MPQPIQPPKAMNQADTISPKKVARPESVHAKKLINKNSINRIIIWLIVILILGALGWGGYTFYKLIAYQPATSTAKIELNIDPQVKDQVGAATHHGEELSPAEGGIGRDDPFAPY